SSKKQKRRHAFVRCMTYTILSRSHSSGSTRGSSVVETCKCASYAPEAPSSRMSSRLVTHDRSAVAADIDYIRRVRIFRWFKAHMQKNVPSAEFALKGQFGWMSELTSAEADGFRLEFTQELQRIKVESGPDGFAVILAAHNFLQSRISPD